MKYQYFLICNQLIILKYYHDDKKERKNERKNPCPRQWY